MQTVEIPQKTNDKKKPLLINYLFNNKFIDKMKKKNHKSILEKADRRKTKPKHFAIDGNDKLQK